jgi:hypothetical protein
MPYLTIRTIAVVVVAAVLFCLGVPGGIPAAWALTPIQLSHLSYYPCPPEIAQGTVTSGGGTTRPANCFIVTATAKNSSGKTVYDADVFGRIYDANGYNLFENRGRIGTIEEIPPGNSDIEVRITVAANLPEPFKLEQFKATGFARQIRQ